VGAAKKIPIKLLMEGEIIQDEKGLRVKTTLGEASNIRVMGRVIEIFGNKEKDYGFLAVDDETGIIQARFFGGAIKLMKNAKMGDLIELVGRLRVFQDKLYLVPDGFSILKDMNWELLRKLDFAGSDEGGPKNEILSFIQENGEVAVEAIAKNWEDSQVHIDDLKCDGEIYEPSPGILRAVE
jgi:hypothetical protein